MLRSKVIRALQDYLQARYSGPVTILRQEGDDQISPPYAVVRSGTSQNIGGNQFDILEINLLVGVFHDADTTTPETAESQAHEIFDLLADPAEITAALAPQIIVSAWEFEIIEAERSETRWQHVAAFRIIASPAA